MPGIVGLISKRPPEDCTQLLQAMVNAMHHEASYVTGTYACSDMGVYLGWVAQEGSFGARQIFLNEKGQVALALAGEYVLDDDTVSEPGNTGHELGAGNQLINLYEEQGTEAFVRINGLFSGLLIDRPQRKLFVFNDRYGMERIYWHEDENGTYFASEAKSLLRVLPAVRCFDEEGVAEFLAYGCTLKERTLFKNIHLMPGGSLWCFLNGKWSKGKYFQPETWEAKPPVTIEEFEAAFDERFRRIIPRYFATSSKTGVSLTGGLDSRMIMACFPKEQTSTVCYTFGGLKGNTLDSRRAFEVARACGLEHRTLRIGNDFLQKFGEFVDRTVFITDGCAGATGAHEIYFNRIAKSLAPVRLTGNFGSEVFRGVSTFKRLCLNSALMSDELQKLVGVASEQIDQYVTLSPKFAAFCEIPWKLFGTVAAARSQVIFRTPYLDNKLVELAIRKPKGLGDSSQPALRFVMRNSPMLARIPTDRGEVGKRSLGTLFRRAISEVSFKMDYLHKEEMPALLSVFNPVLEGLSRVGVLGQHKYLPFRGWFRNELLPCIEERLNDSRTMQSAFWNANFLRQQAQLLKSGRHSYVPEVNSVLTLEAVERLLLRGT